MKKKFVDVVVLVTVLAFSMGMITGSFRAALAASGPDVELTVKVNEKGFFDERGRLLGPKNPLALPKDKKVKLTFVFDEAINRLAIGDVHQMAILADDGSTIESGQIWIFNRKTSVTFIAGEGGRKYYRAYCILDCIGMDHLTNLVMRVVS